MFFLNFPLCLAQGFPFQPALRANRTKNQSIKEMLEYIYAFFCVS